MQLLSLVGFLFIALVSGAPQVLQSSITSPVLQIPIGGQMTVTTGIFSPTALIDLSVMSHIAASNGAQWAFQTLVSSVPANTRYPLTISFTIPTTQSLSTGNAVLYIEVYQNNPWTLLIQNDPIPFVLTSTTATTTTTTTTTTPTTTTRPPTTTTTTTTTTTPNPNLIWAEEFNTLSLATSATSAGNWWVNSYLWQNPNMGYQDFAGTNWNLSPFSSNTNNVTPFSVSGGVLTISAFRTPSSINAGILAEKSSQGIPGGVPAWCSGYLLSKQSFTNGYFEIRAQWPNPGKGMFPAIWMYSALLGNDPQNKGRAEIDFLELFGQPDTVHTTIHNSYNDGSGTSRELGTQTITTSQWHTYGLDRQNSYLKFYIDNVLTYTVTGAEATWFNNVPMQVILNYAMDAPWFTTQMSDASTPSPLLMNIDYVRVYATKP